MTKTMTARQAQKKFQAMLVVQIVIGIVLAITTWQVLGLIRGASENQMLGWLALSGAGVGAGVGLFGLLVVMIGIDLFWAIFFILWLVRKKLHLENGSDRTLRLP
jgi:hypothetical protein